MRKSQWITIVVGAFVLLATGVVGMLLIKNNTKKHEIPYLAPNEPLKIVCLACNGTGVDMWQVCWNCGGSGVIHQMCSCARRIMQETMQGNFDTALRIMEEQLKGNYYSCPHCAGRGVLPVTCSACSGKGKFGRHCSVCQGTGYISKPAR